MNYYYLVTGLPDIEIDDNKMAFSVSDFKEEVRPLLSNNDMSLLKLFYMKFDNQNLLNYLKDKEAKLDERGNIPKEELEEALKLIVEDVDPTSRIIPPYFKIFVEAYFKSFVEVYKDTPDDDDDSGELLLESRLTELYYEWAMKCNNKMISNWFEFNMNLNNILSAYANRKYQMAIEPVGHNEIAEAIKTSSQRDFGLTGIYDDLETFKRISEETDILEREKKIDLLRWQWLDEQTFFKQFDIEQVFAYLVKLEIIERWSSLTPEQGEKIFRELINNLKKNVMNQQK